MNTQRKDLSARASTERLLQSDSPGKLSAGSQTSSDISETPPKIKEIQNNEASLQDGNQITKKKMSIIVSPFDKNPVTDSTQKTTSTDTNILENLQQESNTENNPVRYRIAHSSAVVLNRGSSHQFDPFHNPNKEIKGVTFIDSIIPFTWKKFEYYSVHYVFFFIEILITIDILFNFLKLSMIVHFFVLCCFGSSCYFFKNDISHDADRRYKRLGRRQVLIQHSIAPFIFGLVVYNFCPVFDSRHKVLAILKILSCIFQGIVDSHY